MKQRLFLAAAGLAYFLAAPLTQAQSLWNTTTGNWFTAGNWTPNGVPTNTTDVQINNGGTAQITTSGAVARTAYLGNGAGESGTLSVSGTGTLTTNASAGFFLVMGEGGTGTLNISAGGSVSAPVIYFGDFTGSTGTGTVTGAGSILSGTFDIEVGRSGTGTLNILNGGTVSTSVFAVGNGTGSGTVLVDGTTGVTTSLTVTGTNIGGNSLGSTGQVTVTGAKAVYTGGAVDVGSAGDGTLTVSAGATGKSTGLLIGDAGMGTVTLTDSSTTFKVSNSSTTGTVTVGGTDVGDLNIKAGATLISDLGVIGKNPGGIGTATITGAGSSWSLNPSFTLIIGQSSAAGGSGTLNILNGGKISAANLDAFTDATIKVDGAGSQLLLPNDFPLNKSLFLGSAGVNKLDVTNGGTLATGSASLNTIVSSSLAINVAGTGSTWTSTQFVGTLTTQFGGAGTATFAVSDHAAVSYAQDGIFNVDATGAGTASLTVSSGGSFSVGTTSGILRIGQDGTGSLMIDSGGTVNTAHTYIGEDTGAVGTATVTGAGSTWNAHDLNVGILGGTGTVTVSGGATLTGDAGIGSSSPTPGSGKVTVTGTGSTWTVNPSSPTLNNFIFVETNGSLIVEAGGTVTGTTIAVSNNGTLLVDGSGTHLNHGSIHTSGTGSVTIQNQAVVSGTSTLLSPNESDVTLVTVDGAGTQWNMTGISIVGDFGKATLNIQNGAKVTNGQIALGYDQNADHTGGNGIVNVMGTGSSWSATSFLHVADYFFTSGTLTVSQGGTVTSVSGAAASNFSGIGSTNNSTGAIVVTGANSSWTNTGSVYIGNGGTTGVGTLTVADSGTVTVTGAVSINAGSTLNIGTGALPGTFSASSVASDGLIHFNHTGTYTYSVPTSGGGAVTKDGSGTTIVTGTHSYTGATTINAGLLQVDGVLGNTAVSVANGATLGGVGSIGGAVTIQNGGHLAPGDSPGTMTVASLILNPTSNLDFQLGTPGVVGGGINDLIEVTGNLTLDGSLNVSNLAGFGAGVYRLIDYGGSLIDNVLLVGTAPGGHNYAISLDTAGQVNLLVDQVVLSFWDGPNTTANGVVDGGTGIWNNSSVQTNWTNAAGSANKAWDGGVAVFSGTAGTVTLADNISFAGMQFITDGYVINPDAGHTFTLSPSGSATITVDPNVTATIAAPLTGPGGIAKAGSGTLVFTGVSTYSGGTVINTGTLQLGDATNTTAIKGGVQNNSLFNIVNADTSAITSISNAAGATTTFFNSTTAGTAAITNNGSATAAGAQGQTLFTNTSTAGAATINNLGSAVSGGTGGWTVFSDTASAGTAHITNSFGTVSTVGNGETHFLNNTTASSATIKNGDTNGIGYTRFYNTSTAGSSSISNIAGGNTIFYDSSTAGSAMIQNTDNDHTVVGGTSFYNSSNAGTATISSTGTGSLSSSFNAHVDFHDGSSAAQATITNNGFAILDFHNTSTAGTAVITSNGPSFVYFHDTSTAGSATLNNSLQTPQMEFFDQSTAGTSTINNYLTALLIFHEHSTAGSAVINNGGAGMFLGGTFYGGSVFFDDESTAANATITNDQSLQLVFSGNSTAGNATIHNLNGSQLSFDLVASAGSAIITNDSNSKIYFSLFVTADGATIINNATALVDISGFNPLGAPSLGIGSLSGAGNVFLGMESLTLGGLGLNDTISGNIADGGQSGGAGGSLTKTGTGILTLSGANTYTGPTTVNQGILKAGSTTGFAPASTFMVSSGTSVDLNGFSNTIGALADGTGGGGTVTNGGNLAAVLSVGHNNTSTSFGGVIQDGAVGLALTKIGGGALNLTGINTYTGATSVNAGILRVNGSLAAGSMVTVNSGGTLGGAGVIHGPVTIMNGGILAPGNSPGTLTVASLVLNNGSSLSYELATPNIVGSNVNDLTEVLGDLTLAGTLNISNLAGFGAGTYRIFDYGGILTNHGLALGSVPLGFTFTVDVSTLDEVNLVVSGLGITPLNTAYWNGQHTTPNGRVNGGSGLWTNTGANWTDATGTVRGMWAGVTAVFAGAPGTVTLGDNIHFRNLSFVTSGYVVEGSRFSLIIPGAATIDTGAGVTATIQAPITGPGSLSKNGPGTLNLTGASSIRGDTFINAGSLLVNGSLATPHLIVNPGGLLGGGGFVLGNVFNSGVVSPGNSPGTLHISGNYVQTSGGALLIQINSPQSFDRLVINGHASLSGTLALDTGKGYQPQRGDSFKILTAGDGVSGHFSDVINPFPKGPGRLVYLGVDYTADAVIVEALQNTFKNALSLFKLTPNQVSVAAALDKALFDVRQDKVLDFLDALDITTVPHQLDKIAPEELTSIYTLGFSQLDAEVLSLQQRLADIRNSQREFRSSAASEEVRRAGAADKEAASAQMPAEDHYGFFLTETGDFASAGDTYNANGFNLKTAGTTLGADLRISGHFVLGLLLEYQRTDSDLVDGGKLKVDGGKAALYAMYQAGGFFSEGLVGGGYNSYDTSRAALNGTARGRTEGGEFDAYYGMGYDVPLSHVTLTPIASLLYSLVGINGFDETGSLEPLHLDAQSESSLRSQLGLRATHTDYLRSATVTSSFSAQWQHEFLDDELGIDSRFANGAGGVFTVHGPKIGRDSALLTASLNVAWSRYAAYVAYQADLGRENYENQTVLVGLRVSW